MNLRAITLMGPTASGKTALGIALAKRINGEIISVDSALIYKGMDIGTAKPTIEERDGIPHHLIDILDPKESYSVAGFCKDVLGLVEDITNRGKVPVLVGGTMMYFKGLIDGLSPLPDSTKEVRTHVNELISTKGLVYVREELRKVDIASYERLNENDAQRLGRAYEVYLMTGKSMTQIITEAGNYKSPIEYTQFALLPDRERLELKPKIAQRFDLMLEQGFVKEVEALYERGDLNLDMPSIRCVGYRQAWQYLANEISYEQMRELSIIATCQLAKRQMTWLRGWKTKVEYLVPNDPKNEEFLVKKCKELEF